MPAAITRYPEAMYVPFAGPPYEVSDEFADNFVADSSPDGRVIGLEILWPDSYRAGSEPALLAFGIFGAALAGISWRYASDVLAVDNPVAAILRQRIGELIAQSRLDLSISGAIPVGASDNGKMLLDFAVLGSDGTSLLCAAVKRRPFDRETVQQYANWLRKRALPAFHGAIGVCVFIDETGESRHRTLPVPPGRWIDWPKAKLPGGGHVWAHIAVIPPHDRVYPWLPDGFLPSRGAVSPAEPSTVLC